MGFTIFGIEIRWYGVMITAGIVAAFVIASAIFKKLRYKEDIPFEMLLAIVPIGIICSRLWYVIMESVPIEQMFDFWRGGLTIHGAILGGALGLLIYSKFIRKSSFFALADVLVIVLILAQAIGRWGNFFNHELYGPLVENPFFQFFPIAVSIDGNFYLALFFYESMLNLVGFFMLFNIFTRQKKIGTTTASYLIYYGIVRAILEPLRMEPYIMRLGSLPISVLISVLAVALGILILVLNKYGKISQNDEGYIDKDALETSIAEAEIPNKKSKMTAARKEEAVVKKEETEAVWIESKTEKVTVMEEKVVKPKSASTKSAAVTGAKKATATNKATSEQTFTTKTKSGTSKKTGSRTSKAKE